jgi:hypothetical protein
MFETVRSKLVPVTGLVDNVAGEGSHLANFGSDRNFGEYPLLMRWTAPATGIAMC